MKKPIIEEQQITDTLEQNYMPYAMSVQSRRLTGLNPLIASCFIPCIKWGC